MWVTMQENRSEPRMLCADMVDIRWKDRNGKQHHATALLEDISPSGVCLQLESPIPIGVEIGWETPRQCFSGYIRYCIYREIGYFAGVEFEPGSRWSERTFAPQHLLNLETLVTQSKNEPAEPGDAEISVV